MILNNIQFEVEINTFGTCWEVLIKGCLSSSDRTGRILNKKLREKSAPWLEPSVSTRSESEAFFNRTSHATDSFSMQACVSGA